MRDSSIGTVPNPAIVLEGGCGSIIEELHRTTLADLSVPNTVFQEQVEATAGETTTEKGRSARETERHHP